MMLLIAILLSLAATVTFLVAVDMVPVKPGLCAAIGLLILEITLYRFFVVG